MKEPLFILAILFFNIAFSEWLSKKPFFKHLGTGLLVIIVTALCSNFGLIPASQPITPIYEGIFKYVAPLSIFFMLLNINLNSLKKAGKAMLIMFGIGTIATCLGSFLAMLIVNGSRSIGQSFYAIGGMFTGSYIGGSINFNAVAIAYGIDKQASLFSAATVADNIISAVWVAVTLAIPMIMKNKKPKSSVSIEAIPESETENINPLDISIILTLGFFAILASNLLNTVFPKLPSVIWLTSFALILAQFPFINKLKGHSFLGLLGVYLFLAVIGAFCDIKELVKDGNLAIVLLMYVSILVLIHGIIIYAVGYFSKQDLDLVSIASQANVGGTATALALARSLNRPDLLLPGILVGALGNALGTYFGFFMAEFFKFSALF